MQILILADNQDVTRYGMKAIAAGLYPVCVYVEALDWKPWRNRWLSILKHVWCWIILCLIVRWNSCWYCMSVFRRLTLYCLVISWDVILCVECCLRGSSFHVLMKDAPLAEVNQCLRDVNGGCQFVCGKAKDLLREEGKKQNRMAPLTQTEKEILRAMALGKSTKEIAAERFLSVYTVATHRKNISGNWK